MQEISTRQRVLLRAIVLVVILMVVAMFSLIRRNPPIVLRSEDALARASTSNGMDDGCGGVQPAMDPTLVVGQPDGNRRQLKLQENAPCWRAEEVEVPLGQQ